MRNARPSPELIAARKAEVARRYNRKAKRAASRPRTLAAIRLADLSRIIESRYGGMVLPNTDESCVIARIVAHHLGSLQDAPRRIANWLATCTPWLGMGARERLIREVTECPLRWGADKLGWKLRLSDAERSSLRITTIGAYDMSKADRQARRAERKRQRERDRRARIKAERAAAQ